MDKNRAQKEKYSIGLEKLNVFMFLYPDSIRSTFATEGADCKVNEQVANVIKDFHAKQKPIG